ncbi:hypothetical protein [Virgisporangium aurantiacum]|uniref:Uncharacterized protein n=1 Tax=Virgisporangium aurantiacum TaxID=175570 RepID=A0A8J3ZHN1_9ACTN|nr:hypothetical protein Vau01_115220 [Virgisporangium aurantiacum]
MEVGRERVVDSRLRRYYRLTRAGADPAATTAAAVLRTVLAEADPADKARSTANSA